MKYALVGCGRIAINHIKAALRNHLEIVALCDIDERQIDALLEKSGLEGGDAIPRYTNYKEMIHSHPELELVAIATSSGCHAEIALYCIKHNIHTIIEKPIAMSMSDANEIIKAGKEHKVKVCVCHQNRFNVAIQRVRKALDEGRFGKLSHGSICVRWNRGRDYYNQAQWRGTWKDDGGCLMNQCIHGIDLLRWMFGDEVECVYGVTRRQFHDYIEAEDVGDAVVIFRNGAVATIEGTTNVYPRNLEETLSIFGLNGTVKIGGTSCNSIDVWQFADGVDNDRDFEGFTEATPNVYGNGHTSLYSDMISAIRDGREPYVDAVAGKNALEIVLGIYLSAKTGQPIKLPITECNTLSFEGLFDKRKD